MSKPVETNASTAHFIRDDRLLTTGSTIALDLDARIDLPHSSVCKIGEAVDCFNAMQSARSKVGDISASTAAAYKWRLKVFVDFAGAECISDALEPILEAFSIEVRSKSRGYASDCVRVVKRFIMWA
ncbi:MAG: hypothetical protein AAF663_07300, partial [Planctomycetota bacterium]